MRRFDTGATRDDLSSKPDYEGYLSPLVIERFGRYMLEHQQTPAGPRASDNWQCGIPKDEYIKSAWRHFHAWWKAHRSDQVNEEALCALLFNTMGYLHETLKPKPVDADYIFDTRCPFCGDYSIYCTCPEGGG